MYFIIAQCYLQVCQFRTNDAVFTVYIDLDCLSYLYHDGLSLVGSGFITSQGK